MPSTTHFIKANWPAPARVNAYSTTRQGGHSSGPFASFNLAHHVGDERVVVNNNRQYLHELLALPTSPVWLNQVHGTSVRQADDTSQSSTADAAYTQQVNTVCGILTADCLPVLLCDEHASWVAAIHAGWKGLASGVIEATIAKYKGQPAALLAWLGPAISATVYEVGPEVREQFLTYHPAAELAFTPSPQGHWLANLYLLATQRLQQAGIFQIYGGEYCTYQQADLFFSYRREQSTGRMASLIWLSS